MSTFDGEVNGKAVIAGRYNHHRQGGRLYWRAESPEPLTEDEIAQVQIKLGYHPAGYGGPHGIARSQEDEGHVVSWFCFNNCD